MPTRKPIADGDTVQRGREEESVKFYETMQRLVPEHFGAARIVEPIDEERKHAQMLRGKLQGLL